MDATKSCSCGAKHEEHICYLHSKGLIEQVEHLTDSPTVTCAICLVNANFPENVCSPTTLGGGFKYADMKDCKKVICDNAEPANEKDQTD